MNILSDNFREIYLAAHNIVGTELSLVPDYSGTRVFYSKSGWGRLWTWYYRVVGFFAGGNVKNRKLQRAMAKTQKVFAERMPQVLASLEEYQGYIEKKSFGVNVNENKYHKPRRAITQWNEATAPFLNAVLVEKNQRIDRLFQPSLSQTLAQDEAKKVVSLPAVQQLIDLEGYLHQPLPLHLFKKLAIGEKLSAKEEKQIRKWVDRHNEKSSPLSVRPFHLALHAFVENLSKTVLGEGADLMRLELTLSDYGLQVFKGKDPVHLNWRAKLKEGSELQGTGTTYIIERKIETNKGQEDNNLVFSIQGEPRWVIVIGINQAILRLKERINEQSGWGVPAARCDYIDPNGNFAIVERLEESLSDFEWKTKNGWLDSKDEDVVIPVTNLVRWMVAENLSPQKLEPYHLRFDSGGALKYAKIALPGEFNYTALEEFIFRCSKGNRTIFCAMMDLSGLFTHPYRGFYLKMVNYALADQQKQGSLIAAIEKITDPRIVDKGDALFQQVSEMKESCRQTIFDSYVVDDTSKLETMINASILEFYNQTKLGGTLWPDMDKEVIDRVVKAGKLRSRDAL